TKGEVLAILVDAILNVGRNALQAGDFVSAIGSFREILGLQATSATARSELVRALVGYGGALLAKGSITQAISAYIEAVKFLPNNFDAVFGLAKALFRNGDYLKALQTAEDAMRFDSGNRELQSLLQELRRR
ncbi:MAG: tetratricopeptide repeat protein, partial [Candidatus Binatia bacterium]